MIKSGVLANVAMCCRSNIRTVKKEAFHCIADALIKLCSEGEVAIIKSLLLQYDIETNMMDVLRNDYMSPES